MFCLSEKAGDLNEFEIYDGLPACLPEEAGDLNEFEMYDGLPASLSD